MKRKEEIKRAIDSILNDVIDRGFRQLMRYPRYDSELNIIIREASDVMQHLKWELDNCNAESNEEKESHCKKVIATLQNRSLSLLSRLQAIERTELEKTHSRNKND